MAFGGASPSNFVFDFLGTGCFGLECFGRDTCELFLGGRIESVAEGYMSDHDQVHELLARMERLERRDRRLKWGALACLLLFAGIGLMAQTKKKSTAAPVAAAPPAPPPGPKILEAEGFILKDSNGRVRAELSMSGTGPSFKLHDESGATLVTLSLNDGQPGGPFLLLSDPQHHASLNMSVLDGGGSQLSLIGERPDIQLHLGVAPGGTSFELSDKDGFGTAVGNTTQTAKNGKVKNTSAASVVLFDKERKTVWSTP
jgi:hypothetical protein